MPKITLGLLRCLTGAVLIAGLWFLLGWALSALSLGIVLGLWALIVGPLVMPALLWPLLRLRSRALELGRDRVLAQAYFQSILTMPGPRPTVWIWNSSEPWTLWFEGLRWGQRSRQRLIVSSAWMALSDEERRRSWDRLWGEIAAIPLRSRRLRTLQMAFWLAALAPLEALIYALRFVIEIVGFTEIPPPAFWLQSWAWSLKEIWFGRLHFEPRLDLPRRAGASFKVPAPWNSLLWGVWVRVQTAHVHPLWPLLTHSEAL